MSLIEVLISATVLGVGVVALADLQTTSERTNASTRDRDMASQIALQRMEQLGTQPVDRLPDCPGEGTCRAGRKSWRDARSAGGTFQCTQVIDDAIVGDTTTSNSVGKYRIDTAVNTPTSLSQQSGGRIVTVSVCWQDGRGNIQEVQLERLLVPEV